jgi:hypothetical protein
MSGRLRKRIMTLGFAHANAACGGWPTKEGMA